MKHLKTYEQNNSIIYDMNDEPIEIGDYVIIPDPEEDDTWNYGEISVSVDSIDKDSGIITVVDADDDYFDVEANRVKIEDEEYDDWEIKNWELVKKMGDKEARNYYKNIKNFNV